MQHSYHIDLGGIKDGPHTLVSIMRRIRIGKVTPDTLIYIDSNPVPERASAIEDIALFFERAPETGTPHESKPTQAHIPLSIGRLLRESWHFTLQHNIMTVYAGGLMLINILLAAGLVGQFGFITGGLLAWAICIICHNFYLIFMLRLYRGQPISSDFINRQLAPSLPSLLLACIILALMMGGGLLLFIIPCLIVSVYYIFVPFLMIDHNYKTVEAMHASRLLLMKHNQQYTRLITILILMHYICLLLIIPIPLTLPMFTAALADLYEKISNS
jgi:hypothetical protein